MGARSLTADESAYARVRANMLFHPKGAVIMIEFLIFITPGLRIAAIVSGLIAGYTFIKNSKGGNKK